MLARILLPIYTRATTTPNQRLPYTNLHLLCSIISSKSSISFPKGLEARSSVAIPACSNPPPATTYLSTFIPPLLLNTNRHLHIVDQPPRKRVAGDIGEIMALLAAHEFPCGDVAC